MSSVTGPVEASPTSHLSEEGEEAPPSTHASPPTAPEGPVTHAIEAVLSHLTGALGQGAHADVQAIGMLAPVAGIAAASISRTKEDHYELTLVGRAGVAVGTGNESAQGTVLATPGGSFTFAFETEEELLRGVSALAEAGVLASGAASGVGPLVAPLLDRGAAARATALLSRPARASFSYQVDAIGLADHLPFEIKGNFTGKNELAVDFQSGTLVQRMELDGSSGAGLILKGEIAQLASLKLGSDDASGATSASLALERRFHVPAQMLARLGRGELQPRDVARELLHAQPAGGAQIVGVVRASNRGTDVTARRSVPLSDFAANPSLLASFFDPREATYDVEVSTNVQALASGGFGLLGIKVVGSGTTPYFEARDVPYSRLKAALGEAARAEPPYVRLLESLRAIHRSPGG